MNYFPYFAAEQAGIACETQDRSSLLEGVMGYIEVEAAQWDFMLASPKRRGRKLFGTCDPELDRPLRQAARLLIEGRAKSDRNALIQVLGNNHSKFETLYRRWRQRKATLLREAERVKEIEIELREKNGGGGQTEITSFDPNDAWDASNGTYALINQNSTHWNMACHAGWSPAEHFGDGETLIRRDLCGGLIDPSKFELTEPIKLWSREMAAFFGGS
jgi:hypothetical protein